MARPPKKTLDFFLHDADASSDRKIQLLERKHGITGYGVFFKLLESLCREDGMRLDLNDTDTAELLADLYGLRDVHHLTTIIQYCADIKLFDKQLWESERIVFSYGLHQRYVSRLKERELAAERKRKSRESQSLRKRINEVEANKNPESNSNSNSKPDPNTERERETKHHNETIRDNPVTTSLSRVTTPEWVLKEDRFNPEYDPRMIEKVQERLRRYDLPSLKGDAINWLKKAEFPSPDGQERLSIAHTLWAEIKSSPEKPATQPKPIAVTPGEYNIFEDAS